MASHVWNAVKIDLTWYLVDTTHDSRFAYEAGKSGAKGRYCDTNLFIKPLAKIINNFPDVPEHQFLNETKTYGEFLAFPKVETYWYIRSGLKFDPGLVSMVKKDRVETGAGARFFQIQDRLYTDNQVIQFRLVAPANLSVFVRLQDAQGNDYPQNAITSRVGDQVLCSFSPPGKGTWKCYISARQNPDDRLFQKVWNFELVASVGPGPEVPLPHEVILFDAAERYGIEIIEHNLNRPGLETYMLRLSYPLESTVFLPFGIVRGYVKVEAPPCESLIEQRAGLLWSINTNALPMIPGLSS